MQNRLSKVALLDSKGNLIEAGYATNLIKNYITSIVVTIVSFIAMGVCDYLINKKKIHKLDSFALSISMICGMAVAIMIG